MPHAVGATALQLAAICVTSPDRIAGFRVPHARTVLAALALAACQGGMSNATDSGSVDASPLADANPDGGVPRGWTCAPHDYGDGLVCHCNCGIADPDCTSAGLTVSGCVNNQVCAPDGTCTSCGNSAVDPGEQCDIALPDKAECGPLGYAPGQVPCKAGCTWAYDQCMPLLTCGNGALDPDELCDGAQIKPGLDCTDYSRASGTLACTSRCLIDTSGCYTCGDARVEGPEAFDDGGLRNTDGCSSTCNVEPGWRCTGSPSSCMSICGDGMIVGREACDDGNPSSHDGCGVTCQVEPGCQCTGSPSLCTCASIETVATPVRGIDVGDIVVDSVRQAHIAYHYSFVFTGPNNILMEESHLVVAEPAEIGFSIREIEIWTQPNTGGLGPRDLRLANDGALRVYVNEPGSPTDSFVVGTLAGAGAGAGVWHFVRDHDDAIYDVVRAGGAWPGTDAAGDPIAAAAWNRPRARRLDRVLQVHPQGRVTGDIGQDHNRHPRLRIDPQVVLPRFVWASNLNVAMAPPGRTS